MVETFTIQHPRRAGTADVVFAADYATAKLEALDCRTCRHLSKTQQSCMAAVQCVGGSHYPTMNNEDPADPSVHVPRVLDAADDPLPQPRVPNHVLECIYANGVGEVAAQTGESS